MIIHGMTIRLYLQSYQRTDILYRSPEHKKAAGIRMRIGWNLIRLGAWVMFGKKWTGEIIR